MSGMEIVAIVGCVAAVVSAYHDGSGLVKKIKEKRRIRKAQLKEAETTQLEQSLALGPVVVEGQYNHDYRRFGDTYARGDQIAREQMKDVLITLQLAVLSNLRGVWDSDVEIDYNALQHASDESRVNAVVCLGQLYQRLAQAAPIAAMQLPLSYHQNPSYMQSPVPPRKNVLAQPANMRPNVLPMSPPRSERTSTSSSSPLTPDLLTASMNGMNLSSANHRSSFSRPNDASQYPPMLSTPPQSTRNSAPIVEMPIPFANDYRAPGDLSGSPHDYGIQEVQPLFSQRLSAAHGNSGGPVHPPDSQRLSYTSSNELSPTSSGQSREYHDPDDFGIYANPWHAEGMPPAQQQHSAPPPPQRSTLRQPSAQNQPQVENGYKPMAYPQQQHDTIEPVARTAPYPHNSHYETAPSGNIKPNSPLYSKPNPPNPTPQPSQPSQGISRTPTTRSQFLTFPSEANNFGGFCKGAWRMQVDDAKAFALERRPMGISMTIPIWRCSKCDFEGPVVNVHGLASKPVQKTDNRVRVSPGGIQYRWAFLAKCHVQNKKGIPVGVKDGSFGSFGCIFCCAEGTVVGAAAETSSITSSNSGQHTIPSRSSSRWLKKTKTSSSISSANSQLSTTPVFGNVNAFMDHLEEHRREGHEPASGLLERTKCIIGRVAGPDEEFDINLPPLRVQEIE